MQNEDEMDERAEMAGNPLLIREASDYHLKLGLSSHAELQEHASDVY
jgi:hypothetical protein